MEPITGPYDCASCSKGSFLLHLNRETWTAFNHLCIVTSWYMWRNSIHLLSILQALGFCLHVLFVVPFPPRQLLEPQIYCSIASCLAAFSRQLGKEVVSNRHNICNAVLSSSIAVNKYLKSINYNTESPPWMCVARLLTAAACLPWLVWETFRLLFCLQPSLPKHRAAVETLKHEPRIWFHVLKNGWAWTRSLAAMRSITRCGAPQL